MEAALREIWCKLLGVDSVSSSSNFFIEGGDSAKLVALAMEIRKEFSIEMPLMSIFEAQSFGNLSAEVSRRMSQTCTNGSIDR
ncbi:acyl carrier protein [Myxococcus sp. AM009]|uniref:acyl carrier protein n=1 Tax=unclassified Myxococcus TaxID=2648731 RepID=UPI001594F47B|nr:MULTISPECIES: acyl carrier protein [unclassified Myxococcus]NVI97304.1 acyl carrier protein [Myxococcus sp. AM009]NVJ12936.1 acyl carrier protein [Myxococcus sp. AM010]